MKKISLTQEKEAIVDDCDYDWLMQWKWLCMSVGYAARNTRISDGSEKNSVLMHREIFIRAHALALTLLIILIGSLLTTVVSISDRQPNHRT